MEMFCFVPDSIPKKERNSESAARVLSIPIVIVPVVERTFVVRRQLMMFSTEGLLSLQAPNILEPATRFVKLLEKFCNPESKNIELPIFNDFKDKSKEIRELQP